MPLCHLAPTDGINGNYNCQQSLNSELKLNQTESKRTYNSSTNNQHKMRKLKQKKH